MRGIDMVIDAIPGVDLVDNTEERCLVALVLDCSGSMSGAPIAMLNQGLIALEQELDSDPIASKRVRILVVAFGTPDADEISVSDWKDVMDFDPPQLTAHGTTPTGLAVKTALAEIEKEKARLKAAGITYKRPLLYLMSDGAPTDDWQSAAKEAVSAAAANKVSVFPIAVGPVDTSILSQFSPRGALKLDGLKFKELFQWLSASVKSTSQATKGEAVQLPSTEGWASTTA